MRRLLGAVLARPTLIVAAAATGVLLAILTVVAGLALSHRGTASTHTEDPEPSAAPAASVGTADVPPNDQGAVARLAELADLLRTDPAKAVEATDGVAVTYLPNPDGARISGLFSAAGGSGACYVVTFSVDKAWVINGDTSGVHVNGPAQGTDADCS